MHECIIMRLTGLNFKSLIHCPGQCPELDSWTRMMRTPRHGRGRQGSADGEAPHLLYPGEGSGGERLRGLQVVTGRTRP